MSYLPAVVGCICAAIESGLFLWDHNGHAAFWAGSTSLMWAIVYKYQRQIVALQLKLETK